MKAQVGAGELAERIREEVRRQRGEVSPHADPAGTTWDGADLPPTPPLPPQSSGAAFLEGFLAEVGNLIAKARLKGAVPAGVPKFLRPFCRNQGGYNGVVIETLDSLRNVGRELAAENDQLRAYLTVQEAWMRGASERLRALQTRVDVLEHRADS